MIYGSEIKSILEHPAYKKEVNPVALENYLTFQYSVLDETFFKGIFKLMPGHCFTFHKGELNIERYWEPTFDADESKSLDEFVDEIDDVMHDSVEHHKISDVEVGSFLSSGVDSSYVALLHLTVTKHLLLDLIMKNTTRLTMPKLYLTRLRLTIIQSLFQVKNTGLQFLKSSIIWTSL